MTLSPDQAALYTGRVHHTRLRPFVHKLRYHVFSVWLDIDRIAESARETWLFRYNRFGLLSFFDKDHGDRTGAPLRGWAEGALRSVGLTPPGGPIRLLCFPRILGYVFNPISLFFCYDPRQNLKAIVYEVHNTVGGAHAYVAPVSGMDSDGVVHQQADKAFYVSPFIGMTARYAFAVRPPAERFMLSIHETVPEGLLLTASHQGERRAFTSRQIAWLLLANPLMTLKVFGGILWEAMFIWAKGGQYRSPVPASGPAITRGWPRDACAAGSLETIAS